MNSHPRNIIQFDRYQRLAALSSIVKGILGSTGGPVLDVGGYPGELSEFLPEKKVVVVDKPARCQGIYVNASGLSLPFRDGSFPVVVSCDVLEHIPSPLRPDFIAELSRVSSSHICLGVPRGADDVRKAERIVDLFYKLLFGQPHPWLQEHFQHGLPDPDSIRRILDELNLYYTVYRNAELGAWVFGMVANRYLESIDDAHTRLIRFNDWINVCSEYISRDTRCYRDIYVAGPVGTGGIEIPVRDLPGISMDEVASSFLCAAESSDLRLAFPPSVSVVIVTYNHENCISECLESLKKSRGVSFDVLVIDNDSNDRTADIVFESGVPFVRAGKNLGFAGALNLGCRMSTGDIIITVNPDLCVEPDTVYELARACTEQREAGVVGGKLRSWDSDVLQHAGGIIHTNFCTDHRGRGADPNEYDSADEVDYVTGALFAVKRYCLESVGGLDDGFWPAYYEETDLCVRIRKTGKRIVYWPWATGRHMENSSLGVATESFYWTYHRSRLRFIAKHIRLRDIPAFIRAERKFRNGRDNQDVEISALSRSWHGWWWKMPMIRIKTRLFG